MVERPAIGLRPLKACQRPPLTVSPIPSDLHHEPQDQWESVRRVLGFPPIICHYARWEKYSGAAMRISSAGLHFGALVALASCNCNNDIQVAQGNNVAPTVLINSPETESVFNEGDLVDFLGTVADGNKLPDIQTVVWASDLDGELGTPEPDSQGLVRLSSSNLSPGTHAISLTATDAGGLEGQDSITLVVQPGAVAPTAIINQPQDLAQFVEGDDIDLFGTVADPQQSPETLEVEWTYAPSTGGAASTIPGNPADPSTGAVTTTWTDVQADSWRITLQAVDDDGNLATDDVVIEVEVWDCCGGGCCCLELNRTLRYQVLYVYPSAA